MPWQHCNNWYNTEDCISMEEIKNLKCGQQNIVNETAITTTARSIIINQSLPLKKLLFSNRKITNSTSSIGTNRHEQYDIEMICQRLSNRTSPTEEFFKSVISLLHLLYLVEFFNIFFFLNFLML